MIITILKNLQETDEICYGEYSVRKIYNESHYRNFVFTPHWHEYCEMILVISGYLDTTAGNKAFKAVPGDLVFFAKNELHSGTSGIDGCTYYAIQFKWSDLLTTSNAEKNLYKALEEGIYRIKTPIHDTKAAGLFNELIKICDTNNIFRPFAERGALCNLLTYLFDSYLEENLSISKTDEKFNEILQYINFHFCEAITTESIAKKFSYNKSYFCRLFKQHMQLSPTDYINLCRIEHAQVLIRQNELSLNEIAAICGFNSCTYFSVTFKKIIGMSPKVWKKRYFK